MSSATTGLLQRMLGSAAEEMPPEVARYFLELSFGPADLSRMAELSDKANEGELSQSEREELLAYVLFNDFLAIMQSRARASTRRQSPAA